MSIATFIRDSTDGGRNIVRFLIDVMNGDIEGCTLSHRLAAARLLTAYAQDDTPDFIPDNTPESSRTESAEKIWFEIDPGLRKLIKAITDDGRVVCMFLIDAMEGRIEGIHVRHRLSAAKELLNRAFGKPPSKPRSRTRRSTAPGNLTRKARPNPAPPPEVVDFEARLAERIAAALAEPGLERQPVAHAPASAHPELVEGRSIPPTQTAAQSEPTQPESNDEFEARIYSAASRRIDPNFDPKLTATTYDGCDDIRCTHHGDPGFYHDPNNHHY